MTVWFVLLLAIYLAGMVSWGHAAHTFFRKLDSRKVNAEDYPRYRAFLRLDYDAVTYWKTIFGSLFLLPWRLPVFFILVVSCLTTHALLSIGQDTWKEETFRPRSTRDRLRDFFLRLHSRAGLFVYGIYPIRQHDQAGVLSSGRPMSIVSNHVSVLDILFFLQGLIPSFVAKKSVRSNLVAGKVAVDIDCVFVERESEQDRQRALRAIMSRQSAIDAGRCSRSLLVFPEGTTSNGRFVIPFKRGAFTNLSPVVPVVLVYSCPFFQVSFEVVPLHYWVCLALSNVSWVSLDVFWLPPMAPPSARISRPALNTDENDDKDRRIEEFTSRVHAEMGRILDSHHSFKILDTDRIPYNKWEGSLRLKKEALAFLAGDAYVKQLVDQEERGNRDAFLRPE